MNEASGECKEHDGEAASRSPGGGGGGRMRYSRRRFLLMVAAVVAGAAGVVQVMRRALGDKTSTALSGPLGRPYGSFPINSVERTPPDVAAADWVLVVDGLVERPLRFDRASWKRFLASPGPPTSTASRDGAWDVRWEGVALAVILDKCGLKPEAEHVTFRAYRSTYSDSIPLGWSATR
jgi:DMSO/TMAO reductase YedYZ molybdopterin-dependent catalytic subunit